MFSKTCEYAIRAMIFIAQKSKEGKKISIKEIAKGIDSPEYFIAKILQNLSKKGLVQSIKGPNGGFYFDENEPICTLADIVRTIDGEKLFDACGLGLKQCSEDHPCPIHNEFKNIKAATKRMLEHAKLNGFADELDQCLTFLKR